MECVEGGESDSDPRLHLAAIDPPRVSKDQISLMKSGTKLQRHALDYKERCGKVVRYALG
jgi:hypothetical protein